MNAHSRPAGFTIIELVVTMAVLALLANLAASNMSTWMLSARIRMTADEIENGLRLAKAEAVKQNRVVAFMLTTSAVNANTMPLPAASATGSYWYAATVPWTAFTAAAIDNAQTFVAAGEIAAASSQVSVTGVATMCFTPSGRPTATYVDPTGATSCAATSATYSVVPASGATTAHNLQVTVSTGGQIRMCNPNKSLSTSPDGCPP